MAICEGGGFGLGVSLAEFVEMLEGRIYSFVFLFFFCIYIMTFMLHWYLPGYQHWR
jgi:hypothetical protein